MKSNRQPKQVPVKQVTVANTGATNDEPIIFSAKLPKAENVKNAFMRTFVQRAQAAYRNRVGQEKVAAETK